MKRSALFLSFVWLLFYLVFSANSMGQERPFLRAKISVAAEVRPAFIKGGRLILYITSQQNKEPRNGFDIIVGVTPQEWDGSSPFLIDTGNKEVIDAELTKGFVHPARKYYFQVLYKQNPDDGEENVPGNLYSEADTAELSSGVNLSFELKRVIPPYKIISHQFVKPVVIQSKYLTEFFGHPRYLKASVLLPSGYFDQPGKAYPICYRAPGLNGRYDGVNGLMEDKQFSDWWFSGKAPQIIYVCLDSQGPYGDSYQVDSENNGPCGKALIRELIPEIEKQMGYDPSSKMRFLTGASTGGWVALGLQIFYPDFFDGTWSYSPDPVDFEHYGLINIYEDENLFYNRYGYLQPESRTIYGEPRWSMKECITEENVLGKTGNYLVSGRQFGAYNAVFGPKGKDGLPSLMFDPVTGKIDHSIAAKWEKYDLKRVLQKNWTTLGPKLQGKIWIWSGDMDGLYSNVATRFLKMYLDKTENPRSDAKISFTPMAGHCQEWNDKTILMMVAEKAAGR